MEAKKIKDLKKGEFFTLKDYGECPDESKVYIRDSYDRTAKKYSCYKWSDINHESMIKADRTVFVGFTF